MKKTIAIIFALTCVLLLAGSAVAQRSGTGQASLTLWSCNAGACYGDNTSWALGKCEGANCAAIPANNTVPKAFSGGQVDNLPAPGPNDPIKWNVQVQSFGTTATTFRVVGFFDMQNTGTDIAYLGNLVINLQSKKGGTQFATVASDVINSTAQDAATTAFTCGGASADGTTSIYSEGPGSGTLQLYNNDFNDLTSFPAQLAVNQRATFLYEATFDLAALNINPGDQIRIEALVTFSNAGPRGGSGASCTNSLTEPFGSTNINNFQDINGDSKYTNDERYYRTVPCRVSFTVPALEHHNKTVTLTDVVSNAQDQPIVHDLIVGPDGVDLFDQSAGLTPVNLAGTITVTDAKTDIGTIDGNGYGSGIATITGNGPHVYSNTVQAKATITPNSSGVATVGLDNCATLVGDAQDDIITLNDPNSTNVFTFTCSTATNLKACAWPLYSVLPHEGSGCTYTMGGWGGKVNNKGHNPAWYLSTNWSTVYPSGSVTVGGNGGPYTMTFHGGTHPVETCTGNGKNKTCTTQNVPYSGADSVMAYLPAGGPANALNQSLDNPTDSHSGVFGGQVLTLQLSVDYGDKGVGWLVTSPVGDVIYNGTGCEHGAKVRDILKDANRVLGGGSLPSGCTLANLQDIVSGINVQFDDCKSISAAMASGGISFTDN